MSENWDNLVLNSVEKHNPGRTERHGIVTSYDAEKHLAKVMYQPEGQESGWLPIETGHIGNGYGIASGLQPGDGSKTGDQVVVRHQEGDFGSGKIVQRVHSEDQQPPQVASGEIVIWTRFKKSGGGSESADGGQAGNGQRIYLKNDGTISITDGNGATAVLDGKGGVAITASTGISITSQDAIAITAATTITAKSPKIVCVGETHLGADGGVPVSQKGTIDTGGFADIASFATQVYST